MTGILGAARGRFGRATLFEIRDPVTEHAHPCLHLMFKVAGSDRGLNVGGQFVSLSDEASVLVSPWRRHADVPELCVAPTVMLALYVDTAYFRETLGIVPPSLVTASGAVSAAGRRLVAEITGVLGGGGGAGEALLERAVVDLVRDALRPTNVQSETAAVSDYRIRRAMVQLGESPHVHPDLRHVASSVGLSRSRFFEQFKNAVGIAPTMYVDGLLLEEAIARLATSDQSIEDISASLGFAAQSSFSRFFKERVGFPPNAMRQAVHPP